VTSHKMADTDVPDIVLSKTESSTPPSSPVARSPAAGTGHAFKGMMSYAERRLSQQGLGLGFDGGRRRTSSFGTYSRVVVVAVDSSEYSKSAFDCTYWNYNYNYRDVNSIFTICF